jgi:hypothetical protein
VIRILSQAELVGEEVWGDGLQLLFRLAEAITQGMTAAAPHGLSPTPAEGADRQEAGQGVADHGRATVDGRAPGEGQAPGDGHAPGDGQAGDEPADRQTAAPAEHAELTAVACLLMLERVNYLLSVEVRLPREEMVDRLTAIMFAAFHSP